MRHSLLYIFFVLLILPSCNSKKQAFYYYSIEPELVTSQSEDGLDITELPYDDITLRTAFAGYGIDYAIFQIEVVNDADYYINFTYNNVRLDPVEGPDVRAHNKYDFLNQLNRDKKELKKNKKKSTATNLLVGGLQALAFVGAGDGVGAIVNGVDTAFFIAGDRKSYNLASGNIEDEINYINDWVLYENIIESYSTFSADIIFPIQDLTTDFDLVITLDDEEYRIPYNNIPRIAER